MGHILGIETSCDETGIGIVRGTALLVDAIASSVEEHARFGGVVPEVASRAHLEAMVPTIQRACETAGVALTDLDGVAVTSGPGLAGALMVGVASAKALALSLGLPLYGVNHLASHVAVDIVEHGPLPEPTMALLVSGGHSSLLLVPDVTSDVRPLGSTIDDAAGEAFDKAANLLGLGFPGGPAIDAAAAQGDPKRFALPRGMRGSGDHDFSFSGMKTALRLLIEKERARGGEVPTADLAASFQAAVVDILIRKLKRAAEETGARTVVICGGVARNRHLRLRAAAAFPAGVPPLFIPSPALCTDNAAMVAGVGFLRLKANLTDDFSADADPGLPWGEGLF